MSVFVDRSFLLRIAAKLKRFHRKNDDLFNFRCPLCGDSQKNPTKSRGYVYRKKDDYFYMCHNCGASTTFYNFLRQVDPSLTNEYLLERYKNTEHTYDKPDTPVFVKPVFKKGLALPQLNHLPDDHIAKRYVLDRKIPERYFPQLYYTEDFAEFVKSMGVEKNLHPNEQRLIIPFHDREGNLTGFQGRALDDSKIRYITIKLVEDVSRVFGLADVNLEEPVYVFEGPIDSMFIPNSIAIASSNLESALEFVDKPHAILVFDNEPKNKEILKLMEHAIDNHFNVVIWPPILEEYKDINDMVLGDFDVEELHDILETNTFNNLRAKLEFMNWKKI